MATTKKKDEPAFSPSQMIRQILDDNPESHYNFVKPSNYNVSSSSLNLDLETGGGLKPGMVRFIGPRESGKTSAALAYAHNFQLRFKGRCHVVYFKSEGRISLELLARTGVDVSEEAFSLMETNVYELIANTVDNLIKNSPEGFYYLFIVDSVDAIRNKAQLEQIAGENIQPGTAGKNMSEFFAKNSLPMGKKGHIGIFISQERATIDMNPYIPKAQRQGSSGGGNAIQHYTDWCFNFKPKHKSSQIYENDDPKGKVLGHVCEIEFLKSTNEKTFQKVSYPIRYGQPPGKSVWREREIGDVLIKYEHVKKAGRGIEFNMESSLIQELQKAFPKLEVKFTFGKHFYEYLEEQKDICNFLHDKIREAFC